MKYKEKENEPRSVTIGDDEVLKWEVPIPMVALVATAVSAAMSM